MPASMRLVTAAGGGDNADDNADATSFIEFEGMPLLSRAALMLHGFASVASLADGRPGFVSDDYLNAISAQTTTAAVELETSGMWERRDGGYFIVADQIVKIAIDANEHSDRLRGECAARGAHRTSSEDGGSGWVICGHCSIPLRRPDGGPVALPDGGPLGSDPRGR